MNLSVDFDYDPVIDSIYMGIALLIYDCDDIIFLQRS